MSNSENETPTGIALSALDETFRNQPNLYIDQLRSTEPVHRDREFDRVVLTRTEDIESVLNDRTMCKDPRKSRPGSHIRLIQPVNENYQPSLLFMDPPDHKRVRDLVSKAFNQQSVDAMRPRITEIAHRLLDEIRDSHRFDLIEAYASPLPIIVIAEMLGIDERDRRDFKRWSESMAFGFNPVLTEEESAQLKSGVNALSQYFSDVIRDRRKERRQDIISSLISAEEDGQKLADREILSICLLLLAAGNLTTTDLIGNGVLALLKNPNELAKLIDRPELSRDAVEEMLRFDPPVVDGRRITTKPMQIGGVEIEACESITASLFGANHDPSVHPDPHKFDIQRPDKRHSSFGGGIHFCLGAPLARAEVQIAISLLFKIFPKLRLAPNYIPVRKSVAGFNGLKDLCVDTN
jgi:cytochrome P450